MKRVFVLLIAAVMLFAGCAKKVESTPDTATVDEVATEPPTEPVTEPVTEPPSLDQLATAKFDAIKGAQPGSRFSKLDGITVYSQIGSGMQAACEALAFTAALSRFGYQLDADDIVDKYMVYSSDFVTGYSGNPRRFYEGAGIYPPGMVKTAWNFIKDKKADLYPFDATGLTMNELYKFVAAGYPVLVWTTYDRYSPRIEQYREYRGVKYPWYDTEHCVCLCGFDTDGGRVYVADSWSGRVDSEDAARFEKIYDEVGRFAMVLMSIKDLK